MESLLRKVRVSASTSNLGPGFDLAGLALDRFLVVELHHLPNAQATQLELGRGCEDWPAAEDNRLVQAFRQCAKSRDIDHRGFRLRVQSNIPLGRGLGSSGAAIVAGVLLADSLARQSSAREHLLAECIAIEGHPDNVTPALYGGFTLSFLASGRAVVIESEVSERLGFAIAWPHTPLETARARKLLPSSVSFDDAAENPKRLAALIAGLRTGDRGLLALGGVDRLHERHRLPAIPGGSEALHGARQAGAHMATISGSGSGMFAVCARGDEERVAAAMVRGFESAGARAWGSPASIVREGARVERLGADLHSLK